MTKRIAAWSNSFAASANVDQTRFFRDACPLFYNESEREELIQSQRLNRRLIHYAGNF